MNFDVSQLWLTAPLLVVTIGGMVLLLLESFTHAGGSTTPSALAAPAGSRSYLAALAVFIFLLAAGVTALQWGEAETARTAYANMLVVDRFSLFLCMIFFVSGALAVLIGGGFMREQRFEFGEFYALVLLATAGMVILVQACDLVSIFIGVEAMSLAVYVLTGSWRRSAKSSEGALKYFLAGAFASALLVYGIALIYGTTGTTNLFALGNIGRAMPIEAGVAAIDGRVIGDPLFLIGCLFVTAAFAFKISAVPFHLWAPDAYEGAPTPVTAFMAAGVKAAAFGTLVRFVLTALGRPELTFGPGGWASTAYVLAVLTMVLGNVVALRQENFKRLLAYSSIAHAGYLLVGVAAIGLSGPDAVGPVLYYLLAYTFATIGSFGLLAWYGSYGDERLMVDDWAGLGARHPGHAIAMVVFLLSLGGFPPTAGFIGKFYLFRAALDKPGLAALVVIAVLNSLVSVFYYLRPIMAMYFREPGRESKPLTAPSMSAAIGVAVIGTLVLGMFPSTFLTWANQAAIYLPGR